ncbi:copper resistance protein CopC [Micromonospora sp. DT81.3]|uniref:copper resistance CopC family protein n=1 Tax=Micromonospora sp. DT81.3 TaxID=3416523 RepID=UPI003CEDFDF8
MSAHTESLVRRPLRGIRSLALAGMLALGGALLFASPAFAHDELVSSDPAAGSVLTEAPAAVLLTFSAELTTGEGATEVQVLDAAGTVVNDGDALTEGTTVTQPLFPDLENGAYRVLWKVVSGDGHPISAEFAFTVEAAQPVPTATPSESATPSAEPSEEATTAPAVTETPLPVEEADSSATLPWVLFGIVGAAILGGVVYLLVSRSRRRRDTEAIRASQAASLTPSSPAAGPGSASGEPESAPDTDR